ncbi:hypothetical protein M8J76_014904 [Diaphorina citri]|nr:hypothetical protein M8J75_000043 [Diaphorina citri]KAI5719790.1 hypothetical protein M8J76_014904 [Diaphorina citri]
MPSKNPVEMPSKNPVDMPSKNPVERPSKLWIKDRLIVPIRMAKPTSPWPEVICLVLMLFLYRFITYVGLKRRLAV